MNNKLLYWIIIMTSILLFLESCMSGMSEKKPGIKFVSRVYKFGEVDEGREVTYTFTYYNSGTDILKITSVKPTCGCTVPGDYTKEVAPGKKGYIPMVFKTKGFQGHVSKTIKVETNIPDSKPISLIMEGEIKLLIEVKPKIVWLGRTSIDGPPFTKTAIIKNNADTPLKIIEITPSGERCTTKINTIEEGKEYAIDITVSPPFEMKHVMETLVIMTNIKGKELVGIKYHYYGVADIEVSPEEIIISMKHLQPDLRRILTVLSHGGITFDIINPRILNGENIELTLKEVMPGKHIELVLYFTEKFEFPENETPTVSFGIKREQGETEYTIPIKNADKL
jgi:hypothetical protein